jgi:hypothetical protein
MSLVEWEHKKVYVPRGVPRKVCTALLTDEAERGHWELERLRLYPDGSRRVVLRRKVMRVARTT